MKVMRRRRKREIEAQDRFQEELNGNLMALEEEHMRTYVVKLKIKQEEDLLKEKKRVAEALRQLELRKEAAKIKRHKAATRIQAWARGWDVRHWLDLYVAKARNIVRTVHGNRPFRRTMYDSDEEEEATVATHVTVPLDPNANVIQRSMHTISSKIRAIQRKISQTISHLVNKRLQKELEESRRFRYTHKRTQDPERLIARRRMSALYRLPGTETPESGSEDNSAIDEDEEPPVRLSAFRRYIYDGDVITQEMKDKVNLVRERIKERARSMAKQTKDVISTIPGMVMAPINHAVALGFSGLVEASRQVGFAGVRNLRKAKKRIENTKLPTVKELKQAGVYAIRESIVLPKKIMVRSGIVRPKSRDMAYMTAHQRQNHAVTVLQSAWRGCLARMNLLKDADYRFKLEKLVQRLQEEESVRQAAAAERARLAEIEAQEAAAREKAVQEAAAREAAVKLEQAAAAAAAKNTKETSKRNKSSKVLAPSAVTGLKDAARSMVLSAGGLLKDAATAASRAAGDLATKKKIAVDRALRKMSTTAGLNDALLQISGTLTHCPTLERQWHIGVYPKGAILSQGFLGTLRGINVGGSDSEALNTGVLTPTLSPQPSEKAEKARLPDDSVKSRDKDEHFRSVNSYPLSKQTFAGTNFHVHLTDLSRYHELEIVIFVETLGISFTPPVGTLANAPFDPESNPSHANSYFYAPAFFANLDLAGGAAFPPCGGRMHMKLRPNPNVISRLPQAKKFIAMDGLGVVVSILPVALPATSFLRTFRGLSRPAPCYPSALADAVLLDGCSFDWGANNGAATCVGNFRDRLLVATTSRGAGVTVYEYACTGALLGKLDLGSMADPIRDLKFIVSGLKHVVCCSASGTVMIHQFTRLEHGSGWGAPSFLRVSEFNLPIAAACMLSQAGLDILFTAEKHGSITVRLLDRGICIRQYHNQSVCHPAQVACMSACAQRLYVGLDDGSVVVVSLREMLEEGSMDCASNLQNYIIAREHCFRNDAGVTSMCVVSGNNFLGFREEDEIMREGGGSPKNAGRNRREVSLEGHLVLVGGGDADPTIKVLQPQSRGMRLLSTLVGHTHGITCISADAAGRHFFSASAADHKVLAWDGMTFQLERRMADVFFRGMTLGEDCLLVISDRAPYVKFWRVREQEKVQQDSSPDMLMEPTHSQLNLLKAQLDHEACTTEIATARNAEWCRNRILNIHPKPDPSIRVSAVERPSIEALNSLPAQLVKERWLTQYRRIERTPSVRPAALLGNANNAAIPVGTSRAKERRKQQIRLHAENQMNNSLPGSPAYQSARLALARSDSPDDIDSISEREDSPVLQLPDRKDHNTMAFGGMRALNIDAALISPETRRAIQSKAIPSSTEKQKAKFGMNAGFKALKGEEESEEEGDEEDIAYKRLFPGVSPEKRKHMETEQEAHQLSTAAKEGALRRHHRLNNNAHFSDSDEESSVKYIKPVKVSKTEIKLKKGKAQADVIRTWVSGSPEQKTHGGSRSSTAVLLSSPSPDKPNSPSFRVVYTADDDDESESKIHIAKNTVNMWKHKLKGSPKRRERNFYKTLVTDLRDVDIDD